MGELATVAHTEATAFLTVAGMVATDSPTADMEATAVATTARGRPSLPLLPRLKLTLTIAPTDMVDTDFPTEATHVHTPLFLTVAGMVATDSPTEDMEATVVATTARLRLRLKQRLRSVRTVRGTGPTAMAAATVAMDATMEATADPMVDTVATTAAMGMAILHTTTRQHLEHRHHTNNPKLLKYQLG